jgi:hypothetical protein
MKYDLFKESFIFPFYLNDILIISLHNATFEGKGASKSKTGSVTVLE